MSVLRTIGFTVIAEVAKTVTEWAIKKYQKHKAKKQEQKDGESSKKKDSSGS